MTSGTDQSKPVLFGRRGHKEFRSLSNFAPTPIVVGDKSYPTVEHFYQASKAMTEAEHEMIRAAETPHQAAKLGRGLANIRPDWEEVKVDIMREGLLAKYRQNEKMRKLLLSTGDRPIHEYTPHDKIWGWWDGSGQDLLGKLLIEVREILKRE